MEDAEVAQTLAEMSQRLVAAGEAQTQNLSQALNNTQMELHSNRAEISATPAQSFRLPQGVKTRAPDRFSGRPSAAYPTTKHFVDFAIRCMRVSVEYQRLHKLTM